MQHSILIAGLAKTGTTGIYAAVKRAVAADPADYAFLFEPAGPEPIRALGRYAPFRPILTKVMVYQLGKLRLRIGDFDRRIVTTRDPRDIVVSRLLFRPLDRGTVGGAPPGAIERFIEALRAKEADPSSMSVKALHELADDLGISRSRWDGLKTVMAAEEQMRAEHDFFSVRYEDFVEGRLEALSAYLGIEVARADLDEQGWLGHISRSKSSGDWMNWFTDEDVSFFGEMFDGYLRRHGYAAMELPAQRSIDPATGSEYVRRNVEERRDKVSQRHTKRWSLEDVREVAQVDLLRSMAGDGDATSCYRLAQVLEAGAVVDKDPDGALRFAREAAARGHSGGMAMAARLLGARGGDRAATLESRFWEREVEASARERARTAKIKELKERVAADGIPAGSATGAAPPPGPEERPRRGRLGRRARG